jgi:pyruvate dehydrogenase E2 component (dihydrolipoamide acetyltransferase)
MTDVTLPELGENVTTGDVLRLLVGPGDRLEKDQPVLELETDKATIEVPSSVAGVVRDVKVKTGDRIVVGQTILSVDETGEEGIAESGQTPAKAGNPEGAPPDREDEHGVRRASAPQVRADVAEAVAPETATEPRLRRGDVVDINRGPRPSAEPDVPSRPAAPASPSVRRLARELGIDIGDVRGSGPEGRISIEDVKEHARGLVAGPGKAALPSAPPLPDFARWGEIDRRPMSAVRRTTAAHMTRAWTTIPHVTQHESADITGLEGVMKRYSKQTESAGGKLTITSVAVKVVASALKAFPQFNASIDLAASELIYKKYCHVGVAVDTDRGLFVPVIRHADTKNIVQLSVELAQLSERARSHKLSTDEMQGGCFTITNLGAIGGTAFTPIVNAPEVAILGISRARIEPVLLDGQFAPRLMLPLSLSYDHRAIDGADAIRFVRWIAEALEQPFLLALQG